MERVRLARAIEAATGKPWSFEAERPREGEKVASIDITGVFCTAATALSRVYEIEIDKRRHDLAVFAEPCPGLAGLIELGAPPEELTTMHGIFFFSERSTARVIFSPVSASVTR